MKKAIAIIISMILVMAITFPAAAISTVAVKSIKLDKGRISLKVGETYKLKVSYTPANTNQKQLAFSTDNKKIATVDKDGKITAVQAGNTLITVTSNSNKKVLTTCSVVVSSNNLPQVRLSWYNVGGAPKDLSVVNDELNKYLKPRINAIVDMKFLDWGVYGDRMNLMKAAGDDMDIIFDPGWMSYRQDAAKGYLVDITTLFGKYAPKTKAQLNPAFVTGSQIDGKNYGIPCNKEMAHVKGVLINQDIADKYNLDVKSVKTYKDLEPLFATLKEKDPTLIALNMCKDEKMDHAIDWDSLNDNVAGVCRYGETKVINELEQPETISLLNTVRDWYLKGYINKDAATLADRKPNMKSGKAFAQLSPLNPGSAANESVAYGHKMTAIEFTERAVNTGDTTGSLQCISTASQNPERALMFLELVNTDVYVNNLINFGIEKMHYVKKSATTIDLAPGVSESNSPYRPQSQWIFGNNYINYLWINEDPNKWKNFAKFNSTAKPSKLLGFSLDTEPIKNEVAAMLNINQEYANGLLTGTVDPVTVLPKYIAKLKAAGLSKVMTEKQKQINDWLANK
jgi:putative aldouronate transport system substrate-binding protein